MCLYNYTGLGSDGSCSAQDQAQGIFTLSILSMEAALIVCIQRLLNVHVSDCAAYCRRMSCFRLVCNGAIT
jgi:hypothetical protein